jgi:hypothetical protein
MGRDIKTHFDIDGMIFDTDNIFIEAIQRRGWKVLIGNGRRYNYSTLPSVPRCPVVDIVRECLRVNYLPVVNGVSRVLEAIMPGEENERTLSVVTHREREIDYWTEIQFYTARERGAIPKFELLLRHPEPGDDKDIFVAEGEALFEDRRKTCVELANKGRIVFMRRTEYNWPLPNTVVTYDVGQVKAETLELMAGAILVFDSYSEIPDDILERLHS